MSKNIFSMLKTKLEQIINKRTLANLYKDIVLVPRLRIFCTTLFTNINIKVVIQMHPFQFDLTILKKVFLLGYIFF